MNVYIVPHASEPRFKIGKANDSLARLAHFEKKNDLDFSKAFVLELESEQRAFEVERSLHLLFADDRLEGDPDAWGDGFSEWFSMRSFVRALAVAGAFAGPGAKAVPILEASPPRKPEQEGEARRPKGGKKPSAESRFAEALRVEGIRLAPGRESFLEPAGDGWAVVPKEDETLRAMAWLAKNCPEKAGLGYARSLAAAAKSLLDPIDPGEWMGSGRIAALLDKADRLREKIKAQRGREMTPRDIVQSIWAIKTTSEAKQLLGLYLQRQKAQSSAPAA